MAGPWILLTERASAGSVTAFELTKDKTTIGRDESCDIVLLGKHVSRLHALIEKDGKGYVLKDKESAAGIVVHGKKTKSVSLTASLEFSIACFTLSFTDNLPLPTITEATPAKVSSLPGGNSKELELIIETLRQKEEPKELLEQMLLGLVKLLDAERGFVLLADDENKVYSPVASFRLADEEERAAISRTVCRFAVEGDKCILIENSAADERCKEAASLVVEGKARTIFCGPLRSRQGPCGVLYLDKESDETTTKDEMLALFRTVTGFASEILLSNRTRQSLLATHDRLLAMNSIGLQEKLVLGECEEDRKLEQLLRTAAKEDVTVLIRGETGTGKEMVAKELHRRSARNKEAFVALNCAALPADIIEAELFGAEKGAYTGIETSRLGRLELANKGTLFLDEIGELPLPIQVKLLRVLQERTITRLGGSTPIKLDFRLVCATNADLEAMVQEGSFRQDMYYRINVFQLPLAPLRERKESILPLCHHFLSHFCKRSNKHYKGFTKGAEKALLAHYWPGNIRELRNAIERAVVVESEEEIQAISLPIGSRAVGAIGAKAEGGDFVATLPEEYDAARSAFDEAFFKRLLADYEGNIRAVARAAGIARNTLYRRLEKAGLVNKE